MLPVVANCHAVYSVRNNRTRFHPEIIKWKIMFSGIIEKLEDIGFAQMGGGTRPTFPTGFSSSIRHISRGIENFVEGVMRRRV